MAVGHLPGSLAEVCGVLIDKLSKMKDEVFGITQDGWRQQDVNVLYEGALAPFRLPKDRSGASGRS
jgi:hypothetical protein